MDDDIFDDALNLESRFYSQGYAEGTAHGRLHGLYEGRQLGQEKAWEVWDEVGFYEGFAEVWVVKLATGVSRKDAKSLQHARLLLSLIATFPTNNPSQGAAPVWPPPSQEDEDASMDVDESKQEQGRAQDTTPADDAGADEIDLAQLMSSIRARYRLLCTSVGVRPRLVAVGKDGDETQDAVVEGIEGPMKGVDTRQLRF